MKRRKAIQNLALISAGMALLPGCDFEQWPVFENLMLEKDQLRLVDQLTRAILPQGGEGMPVVSTPEPTAHFVLRMVNDCYDARDVRRYVAGLKLFQQYVQDTYKTSFKSLNPQQHVLLLTEVQTDEHLPKSLKYFLSTTKNLSVRHFTTSEYFMKNHLRYEFAPGRYLGCVAES